MTVKPIIAGTDGSEESLRAVEWAAREAVLRKTTLRVVSVPVLPARILSDPAGHETVPGVTGEAAVDGLASAAERATDLEPGLAVDTGLPMSGPPAQVLLELSAGASMLVLGSRGAGDLSAMLLGSVGRFLVTRAPCPVVIAREETKAVHGEIVVGVHDPDGSAAALAFAFEEAALRKARLLAVHAWSWSLPGHADAPAEDSARLESEIATWREKFPEVEARWEVVHAHPAKVLAGASARADLVVLGRHGQGERQTPGVGSVTHAVLSHAHGPVVSVPGD